MRIEIFKHAKSAHHEVSEKDVIETIDNPHEKYFDKMRDRLVFLRKMNDSWLCVIFEKSDNNIYVVTAFYMSSDKKNKYVNRKLRLNLWYPISDG